MEKVATYTTMMEAAPPRNGLFHCSRATLWQGPSSHFVNTVSPSADGSWAEMRTGMGLGWSPGSICTRASGTAVHLLSHHSPYQPRTWPHPLADMAGGVEGLSTLRTLPAARGLQQGQEGARMVWLDCGPDRGHRRETNKEMGKSLSEPVGMSLSIPSGK